MEHGSLYPALHRLEDRGWIASFWGTSENNRRARYYRLTPRGPQSARGADQSLGRDRPRRQPHPSARVRVTMRLSRFFRRGRWDEERARELDSYLAEEIADNIARGMTLDDARRAAHRKLGNPTLIREEIYTMNSLGFLETLWQDLRYGARLLLRNRTFAVVAILTLALGTGANTAIFQLVDAIRLRTLPVEHPEQLVEVRIVKARMAAPASSTAAGRCCRIRST